VTGGENICIGDQELQVVFAPVSQRFIWRIIPCLAVSAHSNIFTLHDNSLDLSNHEI
jgi:hypothetical protein